MNKHGQALSFDLMAAGFIFLLIIAAAFSLYNNQKTIQAEQLSLQEMHLKAINSINTILSDQNCLNGGIVNEKNKLSQEKIDCFNSQDYNALKQTLSLESYEFKITIYDSNSTTLEKGTTTTKKATSVQRIATLGNNAKKITFIIYEK
jgi:hypothetical protein